LKEKNLQRFSNFFTQQTEEKIERKREVDDNSMNSSSSYKILSTYSLLLFFFFSPLFLHQHRRNVSEGRESYTDTNLIVLEGTEEDRMI
jgi:hypothetical protein